MDYAVEVKLLAITPNAENLVEQAGRLCYASGDKTGAKADYLQIRVKQGHESIIEHASATFYIKTSRVVTHELVRHRLASYSQRSQRYVKESKADYIFPPEIKDRNGPEAEVFVKAMDAAWEAYRKLLASGIKAEIARYVLPNACVTEIICTWNFREIRHIIKMRTTQAALPEMRVVAGKIKDIMKSQSPAVFGDL